MPCVRMVADEIDPHSRRLRHVCGFDLQSVNDAQVRAPRRAYYGAVCYVDDQVGVLLLANQGDMLGEWGLWYKMNFFEPACRIPLIVHAPGRFAPRRVAASASLVDMLPTLSELAGDQPANFATPLDGSSLLPQIQGAAGRDEVIGEYLAEGAIAPLVMIKRGRNKFVHSPVDLDQLYDLREDPDEVKNLAFVARQAGLVREFRAEVARRWDNHALQAAVIASQQRRHLVYGALRKGRCTPWDFQAVRDACRLYVRNDQDLGDLEGMARFPPFTA